MDLTLIGIALMLFACAAGILLIWREVTKIRKILDYKFVPKYTVTRTDGEKQWEPFDRDIIFNPRAGSEE